MEDAVFLNNWLFTDILVPIAVFILIFLAIVAIMKKLNIIKFE